MSWIELLTPGAAIATVAITSMLTLGKIGRMAGIMETTLANQNTMIGELKAEIKALANVVTTQAVQNSRIDSITDWVTRVDKRVDELAHGEGFVFPLAASYPPKTKL